MRRETLVCHGCYGTNSALAIKIDIVLEININSSSSANKREGPGDLNTFRILSVKVIFQFKISWLVTLQFKEVLEENKDRKHLRGSGEITKKKDD